MREDSGLLYRQGTISVDTSAASSVSLSGPSSISTVMVFHLLAMQGIQVHIAIYVINIKCFVSKTC